MNERFKNINIKRIPRQIGRVILGALEFHGSVLADTNPGVIHARAKEDALFDKELSDILNSDDETIN